MITGETLTGLAARRVKPNTWWYDAAMVAAFVVLTLLLNAGYLTGVDLAVRDWCRHHRPTPLYLLAQAGNLLGQGGPMTALCLLAAVYRAWRRHSMRPILLVAVAFILTFVSLSVLKHVIDRAAPDADLDPPPRTVLRPELFGSGGLSFPSGHMTNAFVWYGVIALLLMPWLTSRWRWAIRLVPPAVLTVTTVYLSFHWLSDTVAGILLGSVLWRLVARVPWDDLQLSWLGSWSGAALEDGGRGQEPPGQMAAWRATNTDLEIPR